MKKCPKCDREKDDVEFYRRGRGGLSSYCKPCYKDVAAARHQANHEAHSRQSSAWAKANRAKINAARTERRRDPEYARRERTRDRERQPDRWIREHYKMTREQWNAMLESQGDGCAICGRSQPGGLGRFHVDHDHACCPGKKSCGRCVRGILCNSCNPMIGHAKDNPAVLRRAAEYIEQLR